MPPAVAKQSMLIAPACLDRGTEGQLSADSACSGPGSDLHKGLPLSKVEHHKPARLYLSPKHKLAHDEQLLPSSVGQ